MLDFGEVEFYEDFTQEQHSIFKEKLQDYGIEVIESKNSSCAENKRCHCRACFSENNISVKLLFTFQKS
jgi:hypothetical protein